MFLKQNKKFSAKIFLPMKFEFFVKKQKKMMYKNLD